jgi:hypothetical protein
MEKLPPLTKELQIVQNSMVRVILGLNQADHVNMKKERDKIKMLSVNQMSVYPRTATDMDGTLPH